MKKEIKNLDFVKGSIPKENKIVYDWEAKAPRQFEPWHLTSVALLLDVLVLVFYSFVNLTRTPLLIIGYSSHALSILCIILSYWMIKKSKKSWSQPVIKFTGMLNITAIFITLTVTMLTLMLT